MQGSKNLLQLEQGLCWYFPLLGLDQAFDINVTDWGDKKRSSSTTSEHFSVKVFDFNGLF